MALVHEYLYANERLDRVNFGKYAQQLAEELQSSYARSGLVVVSVEAEPLDLPVGSAIPCGLILTELLTNSLKYAYPNGEGGEIKVGFARLESGLISLSCRDAGSGVAKNFDWQNAETSAADCKDPGQADGRRIDAGWEPRWGMLPRCGSLAKKELATNEHE